ncbi:ATP-binding cassette domain-containing protein [Duganella violaceipulchra]|uniref:AAA family ATPase n=1 Tax=Duganella violaceipulchra TaxID=2849652 RepID=A0AA41HA15_9BURK|nr:AAA family ATPase [Duganella violaceicalia]MCP2007602.1 ABC-type dipeptide/oligopeptide/nickel transport system ATPase subunit [Duganella violaceicalia]
MKIRNVQHIKLLEFSVDLERNQLMGIVGRNGVGKTTLMKAIQNLRSADTFLKTSSDRIFSEASAIEYELGDTQINFMYDAALGSLNSKGSISDTLRGIVDVELPMPFGQRFNFYQSISDADSKIRQAVVLQDYSRPVELIEFLNEIYSSNKFDELVEVRVKGIPHYCIILPDNRYIREDYLSSGEFFLINLYRKIQLRCKLIAIDEIDISLDAAAQVHLIEKLREFCTKYEVNVVFTTHSLAMMQTLLDGELYHMREGVDGIEVLPESYAYIKSTLFGFRGWDRYVLTEDKVLMRFLEYVINQFCGDVFYEYKIIYIGAAGSVVDLMRRNEREEFFSKKDHVISVLDGDQREEKYAQGDRILFIPFESVEKEIYSDYMDGKLRLLGNYATNDPKKLFAKFISMKVLSELKIFDYLCSKNEAQVVEFAAHLKDFLSRN